ncbi:MAG: tetratricopeptide repeat protein [Hyphomicrobiaceae bacterium]
MFFICPVHATPAHASDAVAQELADCQDEEKAAELREKMCTALISLAGIDDNLKAEALLNRGMARQDADDLEGAVSDYTEAIALNPEYPALYVQRADAYAEMDDLPLAIKDLTRAIELVSDDADHFATRGELYAEIGERALAEADYRKALELEADHEQALEGLKTLKK